MFHKKPALRIALTAFLLLLFVEKAGLRLWIHTHYHICTTSHSLSDHSSGQYIITAESNCDCMDDFFMPVNISQEHFLISTPIVRTERVFTFQSFFLFSSSSLGFFLRGPPAIA
jgi:hypothetical protein